ncbi:MAG: N-methyl-L-tryptophan oxidase [Chloroflexota bacterium]
MSLVRHVDAIVLGGGTMGSAAAWELGKRGRSAIVLEQFGHVHDLGAHGGETRVFRQVYAESPDYVPLVRRADELWMDLEAESGQRILERCGGLEMSAPGHSHASAARVSADEHGIPYEWIDAAEGRRRWPMIAFPDGWDVMFSPVSGFLRTAPALRSMMAGAVARGVELRQHEPVLDWGEDRGAAWVETAAGRYAADRLYITAGPWVAKTLVRLGLPLHVRRKTLWWLGVRDPGRFDPARFPVFISQFERTEVYGFPVIDASGLKVADHSGGAPCDPDTVDRTARNEEAGYIVEAARRLFPDVTGEIRKSAVCLYAMTPDTHFIIDRMPGSDRVVIGGGFSGHGFKFAPAVGEALVDLGERPGARPIPILSIGRQALAG